MPKSNQSFAYRVIKAFLIILVCSVVLTTIHATNVVGMPSKDVRITDFVHDYTQTLTPSEIIQIRSIGTKLYDQGLAEYVVVIVDSLDGQDPQSYALDIIQGNLGNTQNNGLLLLIAISDKSYRFEVGRGLEGILNDAKVGRYGRELIVPNFQNGDFGTGIVLASQAILTELESESTPNPQSLPQQQVLPENNVNPLGGIVVLLVILYVIMLFSNKKKGKKLDSEDFLAAAIIAASLFGGGRGGSGGGFGGFGGGGFGGGGAGGRF